MRKKRYKDTRVIYRPEEERKVDRVTVLKNERRELLNQAYKIKIRVEEINEELDRVPERLVITNHAVKRFQERISNLPIKVIKKILSDQDLIRKYKLNGHGAFVVPSYPTVLAVVNNYTVVTCYSRNDPSCKLEDLEKYMEFWIKERTHQIVNGFSYRIDSFAKFRKTIYR